MKKYLLLATLFICGSLSAADQQPTIVYLLHEADGIPAGWQASYKLLGGNKIEYTIRATHTNNITQTVVPDDFPIIVTDTLGNNNPKTVVLKAIKVLSNSSTF